MATDNDHKPTLENVASELDSQIVTALRQHGKWDIRTNSSDKDYPWTAFTEYRGGMGKGATLLTALHRALVKADNGPGDKMTDEAASAALREQFPDLVDHSPGRIVEDTRQPADDPQKPTVSQLEEEARSAVECFAGVWEAVGKEPSFDIDRIDAEWGKLWDLLRIGEEECVPDGIVAARVAEEGMDFIHSVANRVLEGTENGEPPDRHSERMNLIREYGNAVAGIVRALSTDDRRVPR